MKKSKFAATMQCIALLTGIVTCVTAVLYRKLQLPFLLTIAITFGTTFYHFAIRLAIGALVPNRIDYRCRWFRPMPFEAALYKSLRLKHWKKNMPTYDPRLFSLQRNTPEQLVRNMCQAEVVHEIIILFSFVPILFSLLWDTFWVFLITSVFAACIDSVFVMLQRYNRPRLVKLLESRKKGSAI